MAFLIVDIRAGAEPHRNHSSRIPHRQSPSNMLPIARVIGAPQTKLSLVRFAAFYRVPPGLDAHRDVVWMEGALPPVTDTLRRILSGIVLPALIAKIEGSIRTRGPEDC